MRSKILLIVFIIICRSAVSQEVTNWGMEFNFEEEDSIILRHIKMDTSSIWQIGRSQKEFLSMESTQGNRAMISDSINPYPAGIRDGFQFKLLLKSWDGYGFSFYHKYDFDPNKDGGVILTSYDNGANWTNLLYDTLIMNNLEYSQNFYSLYDTIAGGDMQPGFTGTQSELIRSSILFYDPEYPEFDTLLIRFCLVSDSTNIFHDGWMLDNFEFSWISTEIESNKTEPELLVFPNPTSVLIKVKSDELIIEKLELIDVLGRVLMSESGKDSLTIHAVRPGIYLVRVNNTFVRQIMIKE